MDKRKILLLALMCSLFAYAPLQSQVAFSPLVEDLINGSTQETILELEEPITGNVPAIIDGEEYTIQSRNAFQEGNAMAAQWIFERFEEYGYEPWYHEYDNNGINVLAQKTGTMYPDQQYIICGHYDDMPSGPTAPGADDNASGTVAVLEAARLLAEHDTKYTVIFALWDEEEYGLIGSDYYAEEAASNGDDIKGVINLDMIAWETQGDYNVSISTNSLSSQLTSDFVDALSIYTPQVEPNYISSTASDHASFWDEGYPAILVIEDMSDFNNYYHTVDDDLDILNMDYFEMLTRSAIAGITTFAMDYIVEMHHEPLLSGPETGGREAVLVADSSHTYATGMDAPRLYYSVDGGAFDFVNPAQTNGDTLTFLIPGQSMGSEVEYYFAVQGEEDDFVATLPVGGTGINPPGTESPGEYYSYLVDEIYYMETCSNTTPKPVVDSETTYDTINTQGSGTIMDVNVKVNIDHDYVGDLNLVLEGPGADPRALSLGNGGSGNGYINTIFDDEADQSIQDGSAPFTGSYQPQQSLSVFDGESMAGAWIFWVTDTGYGDEGTFNDWCVTFQYEPGLTTGTAQSDPQSKELKVYPVPATDRLTFEFYMKETTEARVEIKDMSGKTVKTIADRRFNQGHYQIHTSVSNLASGQYILVINTDQMHEAKKFVVNK